MRLHNGSLGRLAVCLALVLAARSLPAEEPEVAHFHHVHLNVTDPAKTLQFYYLVDPSGTNAITTNSTAFVPALNVIFPTVPGAVGGVAVDGTLSTNQTSRGVTSLAITNWPPGAVLWLVWEMADPAARAQGLAIDNLSFAASTAPLNTPPALAPISNAFVILGQTLSFTASATDTDQPPQSITFTLDSGAPGNAVINPATGIFSWTPTPAQVLTTNLITVRATDNGVPPLSATRSFTATVLNVPSISVVSLVGQTLTLRWPSATGKVYRVQYKDSLSASTWTTLGSDLSGTGSPLSINVNVSAPAQRFYRLLIVQ